LPGTASPLLPQKTKTTLRSPDGQVNDHREDESDQNGYNNDVFFVHIGSPVNFLVNSFLIQSLATGDEVDEYHDNGNHQ
jgi:hypothetical protein